MKAAVVLILMVLCWFTAKNGCKALNIQDLTYFLQDYLDYCGNIFQIIAITCWKTEMKVNFHRQLNVPIRFHEFKNISIPEDDRRQNILFLVSGSCNSSKKLFSEVKSKLYSHPFRWIVLQEEQNTPNDFIQMSPLTDSDVTIVYPLVNGDGFVMQKYYKIEASSVPIFEIYGKWTNDRRLQFYFLEKVASRRRANLKGKTLKATIVLTNNDSLHHLEDYKDKHIDSIAKVNFFLTKYLIETVNGTMEYNVVGTWGYKNPKTGKWTGMIGELIEKRSDIGGTGLFMTSDRVKIIEYLSMTTQTRAKFIFREPPLSYVSNIYTLPFSSRVWQCSLVTVILSVIVISFTMKSQAKLPNQEDSHLRLSDFLLLAVSAICQMGSLFHPRTTSARISSIFLFVALLFLYTSYTANIVALLQSTTKSINSLSSLLKSRLILGADDTPYNRYYFPASTEPVRQAIYRTKILTSKGDNYMNITTGISRMRNEFFAFHVELGAGYKLIEDTFYEHEKCNLMEIEYIQVVDPWFAIQKHSPYKEMLKVNLLKIRELGLQHREFRKIYTKKPLCSANKQSFGSVRLTDCYAALVVLFIGFGIAIIIFLLERFSKRNKLCLI